MTENEAPVTITELTQKIESVEVRYAQAPFIGRGWARFVKFADRNQKCWICDECMHIVTPSNMTKHALKCPHQIVYAVNIE